MSTGCYAPNNNLTLSNGLIVRRLTRLGRCSLLDVATRLHTILTDDRFFDESTDYDIDDAIIDLARDVGWTRVDQAMFDILRDESQARHWYSVVACLFGTDCHTRQLPCEGSCFIALLYDCLRIRPDLGHPAMDYDSVHNLVWSVVHQLKRVDYLSDYDPKLDPEVLQHDIAR